MMRPFLPICVLGALLFTPARAALELSGFIQSEGAYLFVISDVDARRSSGWIGLGSVFEGYRLVEYSAANETLTVEREGKRWQLALKLARVMSATKEFVNPKLFPVSVGFDGAMSFNGHPIDIERLMELINPSVTLGLPVEVVVSAMPGPKLREAMKALVGTVAEAGSKRWRFLIIQTGEGVGSSQPQEWRFVVGVQAPKNK